LFKTTQIHCLDFIQERITEMPPAVASTAMMKCSFGVAPSTLIATNGIPVMHENKPAATIMDFAPIVNIPPFGMCTAPTNPAVIAAQGAPVPCVPVIPAPWVPGSAKVFIKGQPALHSACTLMCTWAGVITITNPGTTKVMING
jgi:hypothetical protein